jgi:predicted permease
MMFVFEIRNAWRSLTRTPLVSLAAILCLGGAIGAATAVFTIIDGVVVRSLPLDNAARLLAVWGIDPARDAVLRGFSWLDAQELGRRVRTVDALAVMENAGGSMTLTGRGDPIQLPSRTVSGNFFDVLGARASVGRTLTTQDDDVTSTPVVVLSHALWQQQFGGDFGMVGAPLTLDGRRFVVAGVMPPAFAFPADARLWVSVAHSNPALVTDRSTGWLEAIVLRRQGVAEAAVRADLTDAFEQIRTTYHQARPSEQISVTPLQRELLGDVRPALWALFAGVLVLTTVACANVGGLLLVRGSARARETAVRVALGAGRRHILVHALAESILLSTASGIFGVALAAMFVAAARRFAPGDIPRLAGVAIDLRILAFTVGVVAFTTLVCAAASTWRTPAEDVQLVLAGGGRASRHRGAFGNLLAAIEIALSVVLIVAAALVGRTFMNLMRLDVGFDAQRVLAFSVPVPAARYARPEDHRRLNDQLLARLSALAGVRHAAAVLLRPFWGRVGLDWPVDIEGQAPVEAERNPLVNLEPISGGYFETLGIPILKGRGIDAGDREPRPPVAVVSRSFARRFWPNGDALGRRLRFPLPGSPYDGQWFTVVGLVGDAKYRGLRTDRLDLYISDAQGPYPAHTFLVRADGDPARLVNAIRAEVRAIDRDLPIDDVIVLRDAVERELAHPQLTAHVFAGFASAAVVLASLGLATLVACDIRQRTREIGIRIALGASAHQVIAPIMTESLVVVAGGIAAGLGVAAASVGFLRSLLFGVSALDPAALAAAAVVAALVGLASAYVPARMTSRIDPLDALRAD